MRTIRAPRLPIGAVPTGFTLLEILITAVIVALAVAPLLMSIRSSTRSVSGTREYMSAVAFAQRTLEDLRRAAFRDPTLQPGLQSVDLRGALVKLDEMVANQNVAQDIDSTGKGNRLTENRVVYTREVAIRPQTVTELKTRGLPDLIVCKIEVSWRPINAGFFRGEQRYQLFSLLGSGVNQ
ncbi:MAG: type II secretion system protein [Candidatus Riflebacteria bacterium]|nr:type II secretion system protein [Candidatus Riflebacteria bacterium]